MKNLPWHRDATVRLLAGTGVTVWVLLCWDVGAEGRWEGFESAWYPRSALLLVAVGFVAGLHRPGSFRRQVAAVAVPPGVALVVQAQVFYEVDDGANLWPVGLILLVTQWGLATAAGAAVGGQLRQLRDRRERTPGSSW